MPEAAEFAMPEPEAPDIQRDSERVLYKPAEIVTPYARSLLEHNKKYHEQMVPAEEHIAKLPLYNSNTITILILDLVLKHVQDAAAPVLVDLIHPPPQPVASLNRCNSHVDLNPCGAVTPLLSTPPKGAPPLWKPRPAGPSGRELEVKIVSTQNNPPLRKVTPCIPYQCGWSTQVRTRLQPILLSFYSFRGDTYDHWTVSSLCSQKRVSGHQK